MKQCPQEWKTQLRNAYTTRAYRSLWDQTGCTWGCCSSCLMSLQGLTLSSLKGHGDQGSFLMTGKRKISHLSSRRGGESRKLQASQSQAPGKIMGKSSSKSYSGTWRTRRWLGTGSKSRLTNLIAFYDSMTSSMDERTAVDVVYLDFSMAFDAIHAIFIDKLVTHRLSW